MRGLLPGYKMDSGVNNGKDEKKMGSGMKNLSSIFFNMWSLRILRNINIEMSRINSKKKKIEKNPHGSENEGDG